MDSKDSSNLSKYQRYELMLINMTWIFIFLGVVYFLLSDFVFASDHKAVSGRFIITTAWKVVISVAFILLNAIKTLVFKKNSFENKVIYYANRIGWLTLISFAIVFINVGVWAYVIILFSIMLSSLTKGSGVGLKFVVFSFVIHSVMFYIAVSMGSTGLGLFSESILDNFLILIPLYAMFALFSYFCGFIYKDSLKYDEENKYLLEQLKEKYFQLEIAQEEIKFQYEKLKGTNKKLEEMNKKFSASIAEFYTLQQISQAISSILDIGELLKYLNDIIIGVMGVSYSTIILVDEKTGRLKLFTTNIINASEIATLTDNINSSVLTKAINAGESIMDNYVDAKAHPFTKDREINSFICTPLSTKSRKFGLVLIEHKYANAFDDDNLRLLGIISQQVGIAMENAELYHKMHELAIRDGLTGVYNRQYFQERLEREFESAQIDKYPISLAIFDIDHFKRFNDTFGHLFGDKVIKTLAEAVSSSLRKGDIFARFGGEEFIILFPRTSLNEAYEKVESLRKMIAGYVIADKLVTATVTVSFGVSCFPECAGMEGELIRTADDSLYDAKVSGRNCVKVARKQE